MKGILLAGGAGTRLYPLSAVASKQLQPVYDKPMIYYPLSTLMLGGIRDILLVSTPLDVPRFQSLLGDGSQWGIHIEYAVQPKPEGIAQAFLIGADFIGNDPCTLILGDNIFYGEMSLLDIMGSFDRNNQVSLPGLNTEVGARVFGYPVTDPERYGVVEFDAEGKVLSIEEKPTKPKSRYAVPGLYVYDNSVVAKAKALRPSPRGEFEITDINRMYLEDGRLYVKRLGRGVAWLDTGTHASLLEASNFMYTLEARQGLKIACLEEVSVEMGYVAWSDMKKTLEKMPKSPYREYIYARLRDLVGF
ncbi:MAG TPA: glucose-1-phosphate thymidylyltransferase RfbA [Fibrobacteraceae bacterium]|nr:glucose-1-phosphate thymidylyltransferase RfbA [Fibrobacteraceae bacterium]